jgi:hypothetical protein
MASTSTTAPVYKVPLARLGRSPKLVADRHDESTETNGPYIANGCMRSLRVVYNRALKTHPALPAVNPVTAIDWNGEARRDTGMGFQDIPGWLSELHGLPNGLRREFHLFTLVDKHELCRVEISCCLIHSSRAASTAGHCCLAACAVFLSVMRRLSKNRHKVPTPTLVPPYCQFALGKCPRFGTAFMRIVGETQQCISIAN